MRVFTKVSNIYSSCNATESKAAHSALGQGSRWSLGRNIADKDFMRFLYNQNHLVIFEYKGSADLLHGKISAF